MTCVRRVNEKPVIGYRFSVLGPLMISFDAESQARRVVQLCSNHVIPSAPFALSEAEGGGIQVFPMGNR
jgi:hypothetical protein